MKLFTLSRESLFNLVLTWSFFLLILLPVTSYGQQLQIKIISVSTNINNAGPDNYTWHVKWRKDGNASYGSNDKCYTVSNNGPIVYSINQIYTVNYVLDNADFNKSNFQLTIEGWEENKGSNCSYNNSSPIPDRDYAIKSATIDNFGDPFIWNQKQTLTATNNNSPKAIYNLVYQLKYEPLLNAPSITGTPACLTDTGVTLKANVSPSLNYTIDWQYHVPGDVATKKIPNPAYCGPCGGGGPLLKQPIKQGQQSLALLPGGGGGGGNPACCDEPPFITTTVDSWRTVINNTGNSYVVPPNKLTEMMRHYSGSGAVTVQFRYRAKFAGAASSYYTGGSIQLNPPPPVLAIERTNPYCITDGGEFHLMVNASTNLAGLSVQLWNDKFNQVAIDEMLVNSLPPHKIMIGAGKFQTEIIDYYIINNYQGGKLIPGNYEIKFLEIIT